MRLFDYLEKNDNGFFFAFFLTKEAAQSKVFLKQLSDKVAFMTSLGSWVLAKSTEQRIHTAALSGILSEQGTPLMFWVKPAGGRAFAKLLDRKSGVPDAIDFKKSYCINLSKEKQLNGSKEVVGMFCWLEDDSNIIASTAKYILNNGTFAILLFVGDPVPEEKMLLPRYQDAIRLAFGDGKWNL